MAAEQKAAQAAPELVTVTVANRRTIRHRANGAVKVYGPGDTLRVDADEAVRLRKLGFLATEQAPVVAAQPPIGPTVTQATT